MERRRVILIALIAFLLICLVGVLVFNVFFKGDGEQVSDAAASTATSAPAEAATQEPTSTPTKKPTATPTTVEEEPAEDTIESDADEETDEPAKGPTSTPTPAPTATPTTVVSKQAASSMVKTVDVSTIDKILNNGDFEAGFEENGVGQGWISFSTDGAVINFSQETAESFIHSGSSAQRISIDQAYEPDRYGGILQTIEVVSGKPYTLTLYGQIRSGFGSVEASSYGYRMQYAIDPQGGQNWQNITQSDWVEFPWPEQSLHSTSVSFSEYSTQITPDTDKITLFIRAWNKWPDSTLGEYTLDSLSLVGAVPGSVEEVVVVVDSDQEMTTEEDTEVAAPTVSEEEEMVDKPLPVTGTGNDNNLLSDGRFWGAVLMLLLLASGAVYRARWHW